MSVKPCTCQTVSDICTLAHVHTETGTLIIMQLVASMNLVLQIHDRGFRPSGHLYVEDFVKF